jgi:mannan endo-1,4-beta-mannosidase
MLSRAAVLGLVLLGGVTPSAWADPPFEHFITRSGDRLMDGSTEFRFISFNIPNLHYVEDDLAFEQSNPWRLPDEFEIRDALQSVRQMGGRVVRMYTLSVRRADDDPAIPRHVLGPGQFNEEAFRALDKVLQVANETGVRVIVPFVDQWSWWGGISEYAGFRGKKGPDFWTDPQVIADFKQTIAFLVNRRNTYTGTLYRDDKALLAWETGNELSNPASWSREIASYIKSIDPNHLVLDGYHAGQRGLQPEAIEDPNIDILSTHHYPGFPRPVTEAVDQARTLIAGRKPYFVGEVGFMPTDTIRDLLDFVTSHGVSGALVWSLRVHNRDGGFYWHSEPAGGGLYKAYHWPGFPTGQAYDETALLGLMREKAFAIQGLPVPPTTVPAPPVLLPIASVHTISWKGSAGASGYDVERASSPSGPWTLSASNVDDTTTPYAPLFSDDYAETGRTYFYRVRARNAAGASDPSNVVGPVAVTRLVTVDELSDFTKTFARSGALTLVSTSTRKAKEDMHRAAGDAGATLVYRAHGPLAAARLRAFFSAEAADPTFETSADGFSWTRADATRRDFSKGAGDYGYYKALSYAIAAPHGATFLRVTLTGPTEVGRVELEIAPDGTR